METEGSWVAHEPASLVCAVTKQYTRLSSDFRTHIIALVHPRTWIHTRTHTDKEKKEKDFKKLFMRVIVIVFDYRWCLCRGQKITWGVGSLSTVGSGDQTQLIILAQQELLPMSPLLAPPFEASNSV